MNQTQDVSLLSRFGNPQQRVETALATFGRGHGVLLVDDEDRVTTVRTAIAEGGRASDLAHPGHVFPLRAQPGGGF